MFVQIHNLGPIRNPRTPPEAEAINWIDFMSATEELFETQVFEGRAPGERGGMVELKDGRWMMVWPGLNVSFSDDRGRSWSPGEPLRTGGEPIIGTGDPTCLVRLQSGRLGLLYGRSSGRGGGTLSGYALLFRTSGDEGVSWSEETAVNLPGETSSNYHAVLFQLRSGRLVLPTRFCPPCTFPELKGAGASGTFRGKRVPARCTSPTTRRPPGIGGRRTSSSGTGTGTAACGRATSPAPSSSATAAS